MSWQVIGKNIEKGMCQLQFCSLLHWNKRDSDTVGKIQSGSTQN